MNAAVEKLPADQWPRRHLIDVDQYYRMAQVGLLEPDARVELIEGEVIEMPPIESRHGHAVDWLATKIIRALDDRAIVRVQGPIRLGRRSEPQPDLTLLKSRPGGYRDSHPTPADVLLVIEVSDSTLKFDLSTKAVLYAQHAIAEYWVVDLDNATVHCHREPQNGAYRSITPFSPPHALQSELLPAARIELAELFT